MNLLFEYIKMKEVTMGLVCGVMEDTRNAYRVPVGSVLGNCHLENQEGDERNKSYVLKIRDKWNWLRIVSNSGFWYNAY